MKYRHTAIMAFASVTLLSSSCNAINNELFAELFEQGEEDSAFLATDSNTATSDDSNKNATPKIVKPPNTLKFAFN